MKIANFGNSKLTQQCAFNDTFNNLLESRESLQNLAEVTFFVPCYNEEKSIKRTLEKIVRISKYLDISYEIHVYDDGSKDQTTTEVNRFGSEHPDVWLRLISRKHNRGLGYNYIAGAYVSVGKYYMMVCGDDSETDESLVEILQARGQADIIIPFFNPDTRNTARRVLSATFTFLVNVFSGNHLKYYNGVVLHLRENIVRWAPTGSGFGYQAELICITLSEGKTYYQIPISNKDREAGYSRAFKFYNFVSVGHSLLQILLRRIRCAIWPLY